MMSYNKPEHVQTSKPRVNAIIIITMELEKTLYHISLTFLADSAVSQQWLSINQHEKMQYVVIWVWPKSGPFWP